mmetsp:Transcript_59472/g.145601  ORF Transcript_59472/g.145601 Transcript_59472/m.145601 type:complete len:109 (+) Transcript_59472:6660-6986(+)
MTLLLSTFSTFVVDCEIFFVAQHMLHSSVKGILPNSTSTLFRFDIYWSSSMGWFSKTIAAGLQKHANKSQILISSLFITSVALKVSTMVETPTQKDQAPARRRFLCYH